ncbi:MAG: c-type cytochrome [Verrucomicrobiaceae bacterium]|nr:c-type cytochrome [Verrucomicrobiaceae bacterium]
MRFSRSVALAFVVFSSAGIAADSANSKTPPPKKEEKKKSNRGPENPEIKFKLPPPPVLTPEQELKSIKVAKGYKTELVACEPMIETPVAINWDDQGRLYVCEMRGYMNDINAAGEDKPIGRISRLEDTDGDGKMDKATVFVDKLTMPRAVMALGDGALVAEPPKLTFYHDTDGDGVADKSEVVSTSYARAGGQPEHMANGLLWCQDNWIWSAAHPERYRYSGGKFITDATRSGGQWGLTQDDWGRRYFDYNSDLLRCDLLPPAMYLRNPNVKDMLALNFKVMTDQSVWPAVPTPGVNRGYNPGQLRDDGRLATVTGTCGPCVYRGDLMPELRGNVFAAEPCGLLVKRLVLKEAGGVVSAANAYQGSEFAASTDERFRPVNINNGPDGALYITDIARGIVQHKAFITHYLEANIKARNLEQPVNLGRIWRIVPDVNKTKPAPVKLPKATADIVPFLDHPNGHIRDTAQRVLIERADAAVVPAIKALVTSAKSPQGRVQALWTLEGLNAIATSPETIIEALRDKSDKVRVAAVRLSNVAQAPQLLAMKDDPSAEVRVHLAAQVSAQAGPEAQQAVLALLKKGGSTLLNDAIATGARGRELEVLEALMAEPAGKTDALTSSGLPQMLANCVMNERRGARVTRLLDLTAKQATGSARLAALLNGMAGIPVDKKSKPVPRKLLYLEAQPASLTALAKVTKGDTATKKLVNAIDASLAWPGKPGVPPPPKIVPLTAEQQAQFEQGKMIYAGLCAACHQPTGTGLDGLAPPLVDSDWLLGPAERPIKIVLHGIGGPLVVGGRTWRLEMPPLTTLTDDQIASILTYLRREWEHTASPVKPGDVAKVRDTTKGRTKAWTADELKPAAPATDKETTRKTKK